MLYKLYVDCNTKYIALLKTSMFCVCACVRTRTRMHGMSVHSARSISNADLTYAM